jgi:Holliday junction DNA helicase RuvA
MIHFLEGTLAEALPTQVVINVNGVGYLLFIPLSSFDKLPMPGQQVKMLAHMHVREDAMLLYGFMTDEERDLFRLLITHVSGIGPKVALSVLSGMSVPSFKAAVVEKDVAAIARIKGLGKKTAERITLELKDRVGVSAVWEAAGQANAPTAQEREINDAVLALIALGYKQVEAHKVLKTVYNDVPEDARNTGDLVKAALKKLA